MTCKAIEYQGIIYHKNMSLVTNVFQFILFYVCPMFEQFLISRQANKLNTGSFQNNPIVSISEQRKKHKYWHHQKDLSIMPNPPTHYFPLWKL